MVFLQRAAKHIFNQHGLSALRKICVVLPTRRTVLYFKRELALFADTPFISPDVFAIDDFIMQQSAVRPVDSISLIFELYEVFKEIDPATDFDRFVSWGTTLLRDFDLIDQYMVEKPKALFDYMSDAKSIARWGQELEKIGREVTTSTVTDAYFALFTNISLAYEKLQLRLIEKGLAYRGMAYRLLANNVENVLLDSNKYAKYYFVGLNALSFAEEKIIERLIKAKVAETLWDSDDFYMNSSHKAGSVLRKYKAGGKFGRWNWQTSKLVSDQKNVRVIGTPTNLLQAKTVGEIYAAALAKNKGEQTVIVLADENQLEPVLNALDKSVAKFNITMGLSLRKSLLATIVNTLFELQTNVVEFRTKEGKDVAVPKFSHRHVHKVLNHPFVRRYELLKYEDTELENPVRKTLRHITKNNLVYLSETELMVLGGEDPLFVIFFTRWNDDNRRAVTCFYQLIDVLRDVYKAAPDAIEVEYLYLFLTILNRIEGIVSQHKNLKINNLRHFLNELIRQERIPFSGEPIADLQIMSMLETRCLDFDHVLVMSMNEGTLPASNRNNSLIPFDAAIEFGLPVFRNQDAIMSYHFFRLLQQAKNIDLLYLQPSGSGVGGGNEPSRFVLQIENELLKANPSIHYSRPTVQVTENPYQPVSSKIDIPKSPYIIHKLTNYLTNSGLYPSQVNDYLRCSLQFYFKKVAGLSKRELVDENVGADIFGNWLHKTLEEIDKTYTRKTKELTAANVEQIIEDVPQLLQQVYEENFAGIVIDRGVNFILRQVAERVLINFFKQQLKDQQFPLQVLSYESRLSVPLKVRVNDQDIEVKISGIIDRIEKADGTISVVDYKTGKVSRSDITVNNLHDALLDEKNDKLRQLWLYKYIVSKKSTTENEYELKQYFAENQPIEAKIYSFRNIKEAIVTELKFDPNETTAEFIATSEKHLQSVIREMYNVDIPFTQTQNEDNCRFCDFKGICGRQG